MLRLFRRLLEFPLIHLGNQLDRDWNNAAGWKKTVSGDNMSATGASFERRNEGITGTSFEHVK